MRKKVSLLVIAVLFFVLLSPTFSSSNVSAEGADGKITLDGELSNWMMDHEGNAIYATTKNGTLYFISLDTYTVAKTLSIGGVSSDITKEGSNLFIAIPNQSKVVEVNVDTQAATDITLPHSPNKIAVSKDKLFYVNDDTEYLYDYSLTTNSEVEVTVAGEYYSMFVEADLEADSTTNTLYIGESGSSGSTLKAISTIDYSLKSESTYDEGYGLYFPNRQLLLRGNDIFFAGRSFNSSNLEEIHGEYVSTYSDEYSDVQRIPAEILDANDKYVFGRNGYYNRSTFAKIESTSSPLDGILANNDNIYVVKSGDPTVYKMTYTPEDISLKANISNNQLTLNHKLADWVFDEQNHRIYAISKVYNELIYINSDTLEVIGTQYVGSLPSDIDLVNGSLFIANSGGTNISIASTTYGEPIQKVLTKQNPYRIATDGTDLYYVDEDQWSYVYKIHLSDGTETLLSELSTMSEPDIALDKDNHTLFVGESNSTGSNVMSYSTIDYSLISQSTYDEDYGFDLPNRKILFKDNMIFYAGRELNANNLADIKGEYVETYSDKYFDSERIPATILDVNDNYVFGAKGVYDRTNFSKIDSFTSPISLAIADTDTLYTFNPDSNIITKIAYTPKDNSLESSLANNKLVINHQLTDWVFDDQNHRIYAISKTTNELVYINSDTMEVIGSQYVGSMPSDIVLANGKLYIANSGGTNVTVANTTFGDPIQTVTTKQNPYKITTDGKTLYYVDEDQWSFVYKVNLNDGTETVLDVPDDNDAMYKPDLVIDPATNKLFVGESASSGSNLYIVDTNDGNHVAQSDFDEGYGFPYPSRELILNGDDLFYSGYRLPKSDLTNEAAKYFDADTTQNPYEKYVYVNDTTVFSDKGIYDRSTKEKLFTFPASIELASVSSTGQIFVYVPSTKGLYRFDSFDDLKNQSINNTQGGFNDSNQFQLSWDVSTGDGYNVYDGTDPNLQKKLNDGLIVGTIFTLSSEQLANYYGKTVKFGVGSSFATRITPYLKFTTYTFEVPTPANVEVNKYETFFYKLNWDSILFIGGYNVYAYLDDPLNKMKLNDTPKSSNSLLIDPKYQEQWNGKTVSFEVTAVANGVESKPSEPIQFTFPSLSTDSPTQEDNSGTTTDGDEQTTGDSQDPQTSDDTNQTPDNSQESPSETDQSQEDDEITNVDQTPHDHQPSTTDEPRQTESDDSQVSDQQTTTNNSDQTEEESSTTGSSEKTVEGEQVIKIIPTITDNEASISDDVLTQLKAGDQLHIDLSEVNQSDVDVVFTATQLLSLKEKASSVLIDKNNVKLTIPFAVFGTSDSDTKVTIKQLGDVDNALSNVYDFTIYQGTDLISQFDVPVTLTFKVDPSKVTNPDHVKVYYWNEDKQEWELIGGTYSDGIVTAQTNHFSTYTVFEKAPKETKAATDDKKATEVASGSLKSDKETKEENSTLSIWFGLLLGLVVISVIAIVLKRKKRIS